MCLCVLQDQLTTTSSNYERQLSTMSDHLCELNDKMMQQTEELELLRKNKVYTKLMSMQVHVYKFLKGNVAVYKVLNLEMLLYKVR